MAEKQFESVYAGLQPAELVETACKLRYEVGFTSREGRGAAGGAGDGGARPVLDGTGQDPAARGLSPSTPSSPLSCAASRPTPLQLEQERKRSNSLAESLKLAKEQSLAAVRCGGEDGNAARRPPPAARAAARADGPSLAPLTPPPPLPRPQQQQVEQEEEFM